MTISVAEAQTKLSDLIAGLKPGEELTLTRDDVPVAKVVSVPKSHPVGIPVFGRGKDTLISWIDDDEHLEDFKEYM